MLWLLKWSEAGTLLISRCRHTVERLALHGFSPELAHWMSKTILSFTVPVVVAVFRQCLASIALRRSLAKGAMTWSRPLSRTQEEGASILAKRRRINELREDIAFLDAELQLQEWEFRARSSGMGQWLRALRHRGFAGGAVWHSWSGIVAQ
jgi:hypothetical protein